MLKAIGRMVGLTGQKDDSDIDDIEEENVNHKQISHRQLSGVVSSLHADYGIINSEIFFSFDVVQGAENRPQQLPNVGETVVVNAERIGSYGGWRATRVVVNAEDWEKDEETMEEESTIVGVVSQVTEHGTGVVNRSVYFDRSALGDFKPYVGDWVSVDCVRTNRFINAVSVKPLRTMEFKGEINAIRDWFGFVNRDIYFRVNICDGFTPNRGDIVRGEAIESCQKRCNWRAISMELVREDNRSAVSMSSLAGVLASVSDCTRELEADKAGVKVTPGEFGTIRLNELKSLIIFIRNTGDVKQTLSQYCLRASSGSQFSVEWCRVKSSYHREVDRNE